MEQTPHADTLPQLQGFTCITRVSILAVSVAAMSLVLVSCARRNAVPRSSRDARTEFEQTMKEFHVPAAEANGAEKKRLLNEAAKHYEQLLKDDRADSNVCAQALRNLASIRAAQGDTNGAVTLYANVGEKYPAEDWEVLQAWKAAADLLWANGRREDAKKFYTRVVARFDKPGTPQIVQTIVRGSQRQLTQ